MPRYIQDLGPMGLINILILVIIFLFALKNGYLLFIRKPHEHLTKLGRSINTMLFWGAIIVILGFLGTFLGLQGAIKSVMGAGAYNKAFLGGIFVLLKMVIFSLTSFTIISIVWYLFTAQHRKLLERSMKEKYSAE